MRWFDILMRSCHNFFAQLFSNILTTRCESERYFTTKNVQQCLADGFSCDCLYLIVRR
jgi:hypothetical protein